MSVFLGSSAIVDFDHPLVATLASELQHQGPSAEYAARCFEWVRDQVAHSADADSDVVTCRASEVLKSRVGLCYAKSHLLVALLRAGGVPAGFTYQRLALDEPGKFCLHGMVSVDVADLGWYRVDPRGGARGAHARFSPPEERLVYTNLRPGEYDGTAVHPEPLPIVVNALQRETSMHELMNRLPDIDPEEATLNA